jgi:hypothetical protein
MRSAKLLLRTGTPTSPLPQTHRRARRSSVRSAARSVTSQPTKRCRQERALTAVRTKSQNPLAARSFTPIAAVKLMPLRLRNGTQRKCLSGSSVCTTHGDKPCRLMRATCMDFLRSKRTACGHWFSQSRQEGCSAGALGTSPNAPLCGAARIAARSAHQLRAPWGQLRPKSPLELASRQSQFATSSASAGPPPA